jgi:branched-chain amino acid aminotransferase
MSYVFFNDCIMPLQEANVPARDLSLLRGYGIFDYLRTHQRKPLFLPDYLDRFFKSADEMGLAVPVELTAIAGIIDELIQLHDYAECGIRLLLTGGESTNALSPGTPNFAIFIEPFSFAPAAQYEQGIKVLSVPYQRFNPHVKSINYLPLIYHRHRLAQEGAEDVLYQMNGIVSELSRCNVFYVKQGEIYTNEQGILHGITRKKVLEQAQNDYPIHFGDIQIADLLNADEVFLTSTTKQVMPIVQIDNHLINGGKVGVVSKALNEGFKSFYMS